QDNDPKHTCRKAKDWLEEQAFNAIIWPAQSPDLNPIEHFKRKLARVNMKRTSLPQNITELWDVLMDEWGYIEMDYIDNLFKSTQRQIGALLDDKRGAEKY
ncbi:hypothetical protein SERLADRAFT_350783, partial [Serpula lacrymans var. lacrymans S7.9]